MYVCVFAVCSLVLPVIMVALLYFTASMVWALSTLDEISHECTRKYTGNLHMHKTINTGCNKFSEYNNIPQLHPSPLV